MLSRISIAIYCLENTQEAKENVKETQNSISFFVRNKVAMLMCIYMLLANFGSTAKRDTDALIPKFLQATVGVVFLPFAILGNVC